MGKTVNKSFINRKSVHDTYTDMLLDRAFSLEILFVCFIPPAGAFQWELLEERIKKKLNDPRNVELVLERVKCILKIPGKVNCVILYCDFLLC